MGRMIVIALILGLMIACGSQKKVSYAEVDVIETHLRMYKMNEWKVDGDSLRIEVQYGGGAIRPHEFELVRKKNSDASIAELWLLHKTLTDRGRAMIRTSLAYDIRYLLKDKNIKKISLNDEERLVKDTSAD